MDSEPKAIRSIVFASGGSGGHSYALIAIANELKQKNPKIKIAFVSKRGSADEKIILKAGFSLYTLNTGKLNGQGKWQIIKTLLGMPFVFFASLRILMKLKPDVCFSAGGYAGAPLMAMARLLNIRCAIFEQNKQLGLANRIMAKFVDLGFVNFAETGKAFKKSILVGMPCRKEIESAKLADSELSEFISKSPFHIFVFGGSQGALGLNNLVIESIPHLHSIHENIFIHHQTGANHFALAQEAYSALDFKNYQIEPFVYDMDKAYRTSQLVISRAGASTITELAATAKAAILVPLVSKDKHQESNAEFLQNHQAAVMLKQQETSGEELAKIIKNFYDDRSELLKLSREIQKYYQSGAASNIVKELNTNV